MLEIFVQLIRAITLVLTSRWLTNEQIRRISATIVGQYFKDFIPTPKEEREAAERVALAQAHIAEASRIILSLRTDLDGQAQQLEQLIADIEENKKAAEHYAALAKTNQQAFAPMRSEMEKVIRDQLIAQESQGKPIRRVAAFIVWLITLIPGAAVGNYFSDIVTGVRALIGT